MYILRMIYTRSSGISNSYNNAYHNYSRDIESYAFSKSMKATPSYLLHLILCASIVCNIRICSIAEWCRRKPAWMGACRFFDVACSINRLLIVAMNTFDRGGVMAILR
jgi:hypothetical protein